VRSPSTRRPRLASPASRPGRPGGDARRARRPRPADPGLDATRRLADGLADDWRAAGLELREARPATDEEIAAARSTWARRLGLRAGDPERAAFRVVLARNREGPSSGAG
jgi:hypothetical protein